MDYNIPLKHKYFRDKFLSNTFV